MRHIAVSAVVVAITALAALAQQERPKFEVASVRPTNRTLPVSAFAGMRRLVMPGGVFRAAPTTVQSLIGFAYSLKNYQIVGGPDWIRRDGFEVSAKTSDPDATADQVKAMVRTLLEERFGLIAHMEQREMQHYALVLLRSSDRLGPYLRHVAEDCTPPVATSMRAAFPPRSASKHANMTAGNCTDISFLLDTASYVAGLPVIDETSLTGKIVFDLHFRSSVVTTATGSVDDPSLPLFADAIQEQLGLKLEPRRGPVDVLVIDSVQQPTEN